MGQPCLYVVDTEGLPVAEPDVSKWAEWFGNAKNRIVAKTRIGDTEVSTVFLAGDHAFECGPPILWETMVFGGPLDATQQRYSSLADARQGHANMVARVRASVSQT